MLVNILAQSTHEAGHHVFYQVMGRQPVWAFTRLVQLWETTPTNTDGWTEKINPDGSKSWLKISSPVVDPAEQLRGAEAFLPQALAETGQALEVVVEKVGQHGEDYRV